MTKSIKTVSFTTLILLFSGCSALNNSFNSQIIKPKIDESIEIVNKDSIKSISDITSIAFEWEKVDNPKVIGYNFYRSELLKDGRTLKLIKSLNNRYATHFVDSNLEPNTKYIYQISSKTAMGTESKTTDAYIAQTLPRMNAVSFIQAIPDLPNRIKIVWRPHENKTVEYYEIQRFDVNSNKWEQIDKVKGRLQVEYIDNKLENSKTYKYRVIAHDFKNIASKPSVAVVAKTKAIPLSPSNVSATRDLAKKIKVTWSASPTEDVVKYAIFRSPFSSLGYSKEKEVPSNVLSITDDVDSDDKKYYYKIYAVDKDGLFSNRKVNPTEGKTLEKPAKPILTLAQIQNNKAILNWTSGDNRAISYNVYKKSKLNFFEYKTLKYTNLKNLRFEDTDIVSGVEYKYSVQAIDKNGLISEKTDEASLTLPKTQILK